MRRWWSVLLLLAVSASLLFSSASAIEAKITSSLHLPESEEVKLVSLSEEDGLLTGSVKVGEREYQAAGRSLSELSSVFIRQIETGSVSLFPDPKLSVFKENGFSAVKTGYDFRPGQLYLAGGYGLLQVDEVSEDRVWFDTLSSHKIRLGDPLRKTLPLSMMISGLYCSGFGGSLLFSYHFAPRLAVSLGAGYLKNPFLTLSFRGFLPLSRLGRASFWENCSLYGGAEAGVEVPSGVFFTCATAGVRYFITPRLLFAAGGSLRYDATERRLRWRIGQIGFGCYF